MVARKLRLWTGLFLFVYVASHLANHMVGLISLAALEEARLWFLAVWRTDFGSLLLYGSLLAHVVLALWALYARRELHFRRAEVLQLVFGLAIPPLLAVHVVGTRGSATFFGTEDSYTLVLLIHWVTDRHYLLIQTAGLLAAWAHGCIGLHQWLRLKPWYGNAAPWLQALAVAIPMASLAGYVSAGREVVSLAADPAWLRDFLGRSRIPDPDATALLLQVTDTIILSVFMLLFLVIAARGLRAAIERSRGVVRVTYPGGKTVARPAGRTILEFSRAAGIPHAAVCGGRGRCSTCRVRITAGSESLPASSDDERRVLRRVGAGEQIRLACQTRPTQDIAVVPLLPPATATARDGFPRPAHLQGEERQIAILFADLRDFTGFSEQKLPYDVVFVLNRYFASMGSAVEDSGGHLDKFIGDGVMALFGIDTPLDEGCRRALRTAAAMGRHLDDLNRTLAHDLDPPLRIGIGIHAGAAIVGEMGYGSATNVTAIGDSVNIASRLEAMTKGYGAQLVVSEEVARAAGIDLSAYQGDTLEVRGRQEPVRARILKRVADLPLESGQG